MKDIRIKGSQSESQILVGEDFKNFKNYLPNRKVIVLTDDKVNTIYGEYFKEYPLIVIGQTEKVKTLDTIGDILRKLIEYEADRKTFLLAVGGGIVTDIAGFAASTYMRGMEFGFISTTLLSQVDASVGGKCGVNLDGYKNMVGVFSQPNFVICDPKMLKTLDKADLHCGFAEIVKHTLIEDADMFSFIENNTDKLLSVDNELIEKLVVNSVEIKSNVVNRDEKESGERRKLNFGHTFGHAAEKVLGISHGNAVSLGMVIAAQLSVAKGLLSQNDYDRILKLLKALEMPTVIPERHAEILNALTMDKKREGDVIHFVLLNGIGKASIEPIKIEELKKVTIQ